MFPPLPDEPAKSYALELMARFDREGVDAVVYADSAGKAFPADKASGAAPTNGALMSPFAKKPDRPTEQMFGILTCTAPDGSEVVLKAFSGQYQSRWTVPGWVPPLLDEAEFARLTEESDRAIHALTDEIETLSEDRSTLSIHAARIGELKAARKTASHKSMHDIFALYSIPVMARIETAATHEWTNPKNGKTYPRYETRPVIEKRSIFGFYGAGASKSGIPQKADDAMPPTGAGECCAPKLIGYALAHGLKPVSLAEFFYSGDERAAALKAGQGLGDAAALNADKGLLPDTAGKADKGVLSRPDARQHKVFYPPCDEKCGPLLPAMLGLKVLYRDDSIVVVEKPSGLLSVPGRGPDKQDCVVNRVKWLYDRLMGIEQPAVHRLDMETSGILVLAFTEDAHRTLNRQFEEGTVFKQYEAVLEGVPECVKNGVREGTIKLPFRLDPENRPHQVYDEEFGKVGITDWQFLRYEKGGRCRMLYTPRTGRTHQLRLHSADVHGFGIPIAGDALYGRQGPAGLESAQVPSCGAGLESGQRPAESGRLLLHACRLEFTHPVSGERMVFISPARF